MSDPLAVRSARLTKRFGQQTVVAGIDLAVPTGSVYGFLGPNGSGKTTTIRMLLGLVRPSAGDHSLLGSPMPESAGAVLPRVGALVEGPAFHPYLSGRANLTRLDDADGSTDRSDTRRRVDAALDRVGLLAAADKRYRAYSLGMGQRLGIAAALLAPRDLLVLDEPTNGLDPQGTREVRHLVSGLADEGRTVLVSSHLLAEVEQICTHIGVMHDGSLVAQGPVAELRAGAGQRAFVETTRPRDAAAVLRQLGARDIEVSHDRVGAGLGDVARTDLAPALVRAGVPVLALGVQERSLEDLFVSLTGEGFDVSG
ncbi:ATP-binding cassette domain-containing protein [Luteipulveratus sp. YIM 133132]|uniref:ABC transporter ATP-binding protein n=1 Tax=Luteipulveratus flavus TaxID=3031728 RepID=UPI0023B0361E|nr:ATP-binding cassette domain-containing protein [Luteipulveratus sp. YIM 133132]MDE9367700.1 ATP-binding cassette domain-containing protein [Luteipulveratus sp. YIM 133132]